MSGVFYHSVMHGLVFFICFKGIWYHSAHVLQFDFLSDGTVFKVEIFLWEKNLLRRPCEACENLNTDIEDLFSHPWKI